MRIALHATSEVGRRAGLILLAERSLTALGRYGHRGPQADDRRSMRISSLEGFDVLVTDDPSPSPIAAIAAEDGLHCVTLVDDIDEDVIARFASADLGIVTGAGLRSLASSLARHEAARVDAVGAVTAAWTVPGKALRSGIGVGFPEPVGPRWGRETAEGIEVPVPGSWAGAAATVAGTVQGSPVERLVGCADHQGHLEAIALAAAAIAAAEGGYRTGVHRPEDLAEEFLAAALRVGLGVAAFTLD